MSDDSHSDDDFDSKDDFDTDDDFGTDDIRVEEMSLMIQKWTLFLKLLNNLMSFINQM